VGGTTVVFNSAGRALYFSKRILPYLPATAKGSDAPIHLHLGLYAYRRSALEAYAGASPSVPEQLEGLEQLRFLDLDMPVGAVVSEPLAWDPIELNNPSDVPVIEHLLAARGIA
jgi:3-deoxy-manno-octulosonate cytidylyltransferase (CMP-KDO synthetase)